MKIQIIDSGIPTLLDISQDEVKGLAELGVAILEHVFLSDGQYERQLFSFSIDTSGERGEEISHLLMETVFDFEDANLRYLHAIRNPGYLVVYFVSREPVRDRALAEALDRMMIGKLMGKGIAQYQYDDLD